MAFNPFIGQPREWLENELRAAQEDFSSGQAVLKAGAGDTNTESRSDASSISRIKLLLRALNLIAPEDYPIDQVTAIDSTRVVFNTSGITPFI